MEQQKLDNKLNNNFNNNLKDNSAEKNKRKIRAFCGLCYQTFENGPTSKLCKEHYIKGKCNLFECKKLNSKCVRRFHNTNSENRHTYCVTRDIVDTYDSTLEIQSILCKII